METGLARIGELLVGAGIMDADNLAQALHIASKAACPVGRILQLTGNLKERDLKNALEAQTMIRQNEIDLDFAIEVLNTAFKGCLTFQQALAKHGWHRSEQQSLTDMSELLLMSGVLSSVQLKKAIENSQQLNLPLGRTLIQTDLVSPSVMAAVLTSLVLIRKGEINHDEAVRGIRVVATKCISLEQALILDGSYCPPNNYSIRLGELLGLAGLVSETDNLYAVEKGLLSRQLVGQILCEAGLVSPHVVESAVELQRMVTAGAIDARQASDILRNIERTGISVEEAVNSKKRNGDQVASLLKIADFITDSDIVRAEALSRGSSFDLSQCLYDSLVIDEIQFKTANRCLELINGGHLQVEQAVIVMHYCVRTQVSVDQALQELAWDLSSNPSIELHSERVQLNQKQRDHS